MQESSHPTTSDITTLDMLTRPSWFAPLLLALAAGLSYVFADRNLPIPDEGALLTAAVKVLHGGVFYRDVDAYALPGATYLLVGAMSIFGEHLSVARALAGSIFCAMTLGVYACALTLVDAKRAALCGLSLLSLKFFAYPIYSTYFYADPSLAAAILALAIFLRHKFDGASARLFWVGIFVGLSIVTKQSTGIYVAAVFALVLWFPVLAHGPRRQGRRVEEVSAYSAGLLLVIGSMSGYFASHGLLAEMVHSALVRPFTGYLGTSNIPFAPALEWWNFGALRSEGTVYLAQHYQELVYTNSLPGGAALQNLYWTVGELASRVLYGAIPIVFGTCAWLWIRAFREAPSNADTPQSVLARSRFFIAAGVTLGITASAFPRADFTHIITIYPAVVLILFALCRPSLLGTGWKGGAEATPGNQMRRLKIEAAFVALLLMTTTALAVRYDARLTHRLSMDRADLWVRTEDAWLKPLIEYIQREVPEGEPLFIYGHEAQWYYLSDRYTPRAFSQLYPGMTGDDTGEKIASLIRKTRPRVIVRGILKWKGVPPVVDYTRKVKDTIPLLYKDVPQITQLRPHPWVFGVWRLRG